MVLKQAPRCWIEKLHKTLISAGFRQNNSGNSLYSKTKDDKTAYVYIYLDDIIITGSYTDAIRSIK